MKSLLHIIADLMIHFFYKNFNIDSNAWSRKELLKYAWRQKIMGHNRKVPWPVHFTSLVKCHEKIQRGSKAPGSAPGCYIDGRNGIKIEENVWIGPKVSIISQNHNKFDFTTYESSDPVIIRKNSWLSTSCIILPGVELGEHTIVAAGAVVTKSFTEGNQLIAGNPAKVIKKLENYKG